MPPISAYDINSILYLNIIARKLERYSAAAIIRELQKTFGTLSYKRVLTIIEAYKQQKAGNVLRSYSRIKFIASEIYEIKTLMSNAYRTDNSITARRMIKMIQESLELFKRIGCFTQIQLLEGDQLPSTRSIFTYGQGYHVEEQHRFVCGMAERVYSLFIIHLDLY
uniref:Transposase n=1 Tax=Heterorhabditis bacteriophora TaxID=37862 RepID=A0A1I7XCY2_HETBA